MTPGKVSPLAKVKALFLLLCVIDGADVFWMLGAAAITVGCWKITEALGWITLGVFFCAFGYLLSLRSPLSR
jgi:hypothetical protein